jgi:hypothetical protein
MRRLLVLSCVTAMLGMLVAVAPAVVRPDANRAEAYVNCDIVRQTVARHDIWAAKILLCVEVLGSGVRPGVKVWCETGSNTQFPCNWDFNPLHAHDLNTTLIHSERAHETGKTNGAYIATPNWGNRSRCTSGAAYSDAPLLRVRFPDGHLTPWVDAFWQAGYHVGC